jgi:hypothetical protein
VPDPRARAVRYRSGAHSCDFARRFLGSSCASLLAITAGKPAPAEPGLLWSDAAATRLLEWRRRYVTTTPVRSSGGGG